MEVVVVVVVVVWIGWVVVGEGWLTLRELGHICE